MKRSERVNRWFAVMQMLEKQVKMVDRIEHNSTVEVNEIKAALNSAICAVDQILSCNYNT